jgi:hypothetical protein
LKLKCDELLSNFAFNFNVRRYSAVVSALQAEALRKQLAKVGLCRLTLPNPP